jgi:hypothetical protein
LRLALALSCALGLSAPLASSAHADVSVFAPDGTPRGTLTGVPGVGCITPTGKHLVTPGAGLWTSSGVPQTSSWATVAGGPCVADGSGNVYVARRPSDSSWTLTQYTLKGKLVRVHAVTPLMSRFNFAIDLAPDECTMYYGAYAALGSDTLGRFDVCRGVQLPTLQGGWSNDLRVLADWRVLSLDDPFAVRLDPSGALQSQFYRPPVQTEMLRRLALDPDGRSFWACCSTTPELFRFDLETGATLARWTPGAAPATPVTPRRGDLLWTGTPVVFGPPLVGNAEIEDFVDANPAGTAQAFRAQAQHDGPLSRLRLYLDATSTAREVVVGVYADRSGRPGSLLTQATIGAPRAGSWNTVDLGAVTIDAGTRYWIAVLAPAGAGTVKFRAQEGGGRSETSAVTSLSRLPSTWTTGAVWTTAPASAYGI